MYGVVQHRRGQIVRQSDRIEVAGEVEVDVLHQHNLRVATASSTALRAEHRSQAGLAQSEDRLTRGGLTSGDLAAVALVEAVRQANAGRRLPLPRRRGAHRGDKHELAGCRVRLKVLETASGTFTFVQLYGMRSSALSPTASAMSVIHFSVAA